MKLIKKQFSKESLSLDGIKVQIYRFKFKSGKRPSKGIIIWCQGKEPLIKIKKIKTKVKGENFSSYLT